MEDDKENAQNNKEVEKRDVDKLSEAIGAFGKWQLLILLSLSIPVKTMSTWVGIVTVYLAPKTTYRCIEFPSNFTADTSIGNSTCIEGCLRYEYYSVFEDTIITEWQLICDREWLPNLSQCICMFGELVGSMILGFIADRYGRKNTMIASAFLQFISGLTIPFAPNYWTFTFIRFVQGCETGGTMVVSFVIVMEIIGPGCRNTVGCLFQLPVAITQMILALIAYYVRNWQTISFILVAPMLLYLGYFFVIPESPKWLIATGRLEEANEVMIKAARRNNKNQDNIKQVIDSMAKEIIKKKDTESKANYLALVRIKRLRNRNIISCVAWLILGMNQYGINLYIGQYSSNTFVSIALAGAVLVPGIFLGILLNKYLGRRLTVIIFFIASGVCMFVMAFADGIYWLQLVSGSVGNCSVSAAFTTMYIYTTELFPTTIRNMAMGTSSTSARVGTMAAPFVSGLAVHGLWIPPVVFSIGPFIAGSLCIWLPETGGRSLPDSLYDGT